MDEKFLESMRGEPRPAFTRALRERLERIEDEEAARPAWRWPVLAAAAALAVVAAAFAFPSVRASAQAMLDVFRVREFSIVTVDESRLQALRDRKLDPASLLGGKPVVLEAPGEPRRFASLEAAAAATGLAPVRPTALPRGLALDSVFVSGQARSRVTVDTKPLRDLMGAFDVNDLDVPPGLDGATVEMRVPPVVVERFRSSGRTRAAFFQCAGPEVSLPPGVDLARVGEIGLRLLGLPADDAHRMAARIDWRTTLVVPVVASAQTFQQVDVNGAHGVYVESDRKRAGADARLPGATVLWSRGERVYGLSANLDRLSLLQMAESVR